MWTALELLVLWLVAQAAVTDLALRKIPNILVVSGLALALVLHGLAGPPLAALMHWLTGLLAGFFLLLPLYLLRGMAAGDVKLIAMVGAFVGPQAVLHVALLTYLLGAPLALATLVWHGWRQGTGLAIARQLGRNLWRLVQPWLGRLVGLPLAPLPRETIASVGGMPYGVAIALATVAVVAWPHR
ncbi:A24 family peptidase [Duganella phyllosphaerae]|uniref:Type IV leader peptidase family protein n=1 Tax=Duganella phyllosphaerae TaxID=762836 RepID=A0A1E7WBX2_9BURK|nr:prepilin peptidase [Duganella phyllosphaerae]OEZ94350.1 type IV leader peptidase family protein [Duganella phyllosphaerae]